MLSYEVKNLIMKLFFISDIHGSAKYTKIALDMFIKEKADYLIILGDVLNHGPRNPLPEGYNPKEVAELLNKYSQKIIAVRGNCDSEVDTMMLQYPFMVDYNVLLYKNIKLFLTHGHIYEDYSKLNLCSKDVIIHGHTHIPYIKPTKDGIIINPGSITYPKENNPHTYGILEDDKFFIKTLEGIIYMEACL
jgi:putative phosphoesterase